MALRVEEEVVEVLHVRVLLCEEDKCTGAHSARSRHPSHSCSPYSSLTDGWWSRKWACNASRAATEDTPHVSSVTAATNLDLAQKKSLKNVPVHVHSGRKHGYNSRSTSPIRSFMHTCKLAPNDA